MFSNSEVKVFRIVNFIFIWLPEVKKEYVISTRLRYRSGNKRIRLTKYTLEKITCGYTKETDLEAHPYLTLHRPYSDYPRKIEFKDDSA